jgi:coenzyme F420-0:L-glutamate ligase/coenzyme F420-1:gamma-L-glutamate ligase
MSDEIRIIPIRGVGEVRPGDDVAAILAQAFEAQGQHFETGDVLVVTQKIVSKAEDRIVELTTVTPSEQALELARINGRDARQIEVALRETAKVVRLDMQRGILISETRHGFVCANAGVDGSNLAEATEVCMLPIDSDVSAEGIRTAIRERNGAEIAVIISDTFGRAWRQGQVNVAIGLAGMQAVHDYRGQTDSAGLILVVTEIAVADELASAAELVTGKLDRVPASVIRGYAFQAGEGKATDLVRAAEFDMFR